METESWIWGPRHSIGARTYVGVAGDTGGITSVYVEDGGTRRPLRQVVCHSPSGMSWGYAGSGPADLALSILADVLGETPTRAELYQGDALCWTLHQDFKFDVIARLPQRQDFRLSALDVVDWIEAYQDKIAHYFEEGEFLFG